jgi:hypothetical protein
LQTAEQLEAKGLRRNDRTPKEVAILLIGSDPLGREFVEQTRTVVLSRHGAGLVSMHKLSVEQELIVVLQESKKEAEIRVVGQIGKEGNCYTYGVAFLDPAVDFWGLEFPSAPQMEILDSRKLLQCSTCTSAEVVDFGALESDIYAMHDGILRSCKQCSGLTLWKKSPGEIQGKPSVSEELSVSTEAAPAPETTPSPARFKNRRQHVRIKVNFTAFVRSQSFEDDTVLCENISRGGLCFKSSRHYCETSSIEVAAPYCPGSPCIRVPAQIVYVQELPEEKTFRYGVQYL